MAEWFSAQFLQWCHCTSCTAATVLRYRKFEIRLLIIVRKYFYLDYSRDFSWAQWHQKNSRSATV